MLISLNTHKSTIHRMNKIPNSTFYMDRPDQAEKNKNQSRLRRDVSIILMASFIAMHIAVQHGSQKLTLNECDVGCNHV